MKTVADELRAEITRLDASVAWAEKCADDNPDHPETAELSRDYVASLNKRKAQLQAQLEREEALYVKPQPTGVTIGGFDV